MLTSCSKGLEETVVEEKISKSERVIQKLEAENIKVHSDLLPNNVSEERNDPITHIVIHFTSNAALNPKNPYKLEEIRQNFIDYGVSAHYLIDRQGEVYYWVPIERVAYHAGKGQLEQFPEYTDRLNHHSIGIELMGIGTKDEMEIMMENERYDLIDISHIGYTDAQYETLNKMIDILVDQFPEIEKNRVHIIGHDEYAPNRKTDPGSLFDWGKIGF